MYPFNQFPTDFQFPSDAMYQPHYSFPDDNSVAQDPSAFPDMYRRPSVDTSDAPLNYNYPYQPIVYQQQPHLHAPVPLLPQYPPQPATRQDTPVISQPEHVLYPPAALDYYESGPQLLFPTPSELLTDLAALDAQSRVTDPPQAASQPPTASPSQTLVDPSEPSSESSSAVPSVTKTESQRKARQRAVAEEIGFTPTDPDSISSHDKKRHYLECVEQYVTYLHEQLRLVATEPLEFERVSTYRGLSSRSIRTLLVHMQNTNKQLHASTLEEERVFIDLSEQIMAADSGEPPHRRHSVDIAGVPGYPSAASGSYLTPPPTENA
ncbi:hypothetical protein BV22DRAFT_26012 [Leucogyrophana mollusca]|uniref:Uncharacterized protein n=1 Tax=Leucogyrophana mollusca TaxID=85980 RepID=A0ACB8BZX4_9AGAM|nr:hypothetical protein BV22DRAFT_26012 [Leucogyrophana mollusca]